MIRLLACIALVWMANASVADAHTRSTSQSLWSVDGDALDVRVEADALDVTRLYALGGNQPLTDAMRDEVREAFTVHASSRLCASVGEPHAGIAAGGRVVVAWRFACPVGALARGPIDIESRLFLRVAPSHLHFVAVRDAAGRTAEAVLTEGRPSASLSLAGAPREQSLWTTVARFIPIGAEHVWTGPDHMAFIIALLLLAQGKLRGVIFAATGFTLGHTLTLGLAATGVLHPDTHAIEALIGFTIAFVALEAGGGGAERMLAWSGPGAVLLGAGGVAALAGFLPMSPLVWFGLAAFLFAYPRGFPREAFWVAAIFGLIHGCGFAGALSALDLPKQRLIASLFGFNVGVEAGQLTVIAVALLIGLAVQRLAPTRIRAEGPAIAAAVLFAIGSYWFIGRLLAA